MTPAIARGIHAAAALVIVASALAATATLTAAPARAIVCTAEQGAQYVSILTLNGIYNDLGPSAEASVGCGIANDIDNRVRDPLQERNYICGLNKRLSYTDCNVMVNAATEVYLGFGPASGV